MNSVCTCSWRRRLSLFMQTRFILRRASCQHHWCQVRWQQNNLEKAGFLKHYLMWNNDLWVRLVVTSVTSIFTLHYTCPFVHITVLSVYCPACWSLSALTRRPWLGGVGLWAQQLAPAPGRSTSSSYPTVIDGHSCILLVWGLRMSLYAFIYYILCCCKPLL